MVSRYFLGLMLAFGGLTCGGPASAMDVDTFVGRVLDKRLTRVEDALGELPAEYWSYYTLVRDSRSSQAATARSPRVILFGRQASFIVAYNGDPKLPGFDTLEMIQVRDGGARFEFRQLRFPGASNRLTEAKPSEVNPRACLSCHQADPRPNWDPYSVWHGAYGEAGDILTPSEAADYRAFLSGRAAEPRYARLQRPGDSPVSPYRDRLPEEEMGPNRFFTKLVARWNAKRIAGKLLSGVAGRDRLALPALLFGCANLAPGAWERVARALGVPSAAEARAALSTGHRAATDTLLRLRGIEAADWDLTFVPHDRQPPTRYYYFDGLFSLRQLVHFALLDRLKGEFPEIAPIAGKFGYYEGEASLGGSRGEQMQYLVNVLGGVPSASPSEACPVLARALARP